jgi:PAS domain S-box-containing protein
MSQPIHPRPTVVKETHSLQEENAPPREKQNPASSNAAEQQFRVLFEMNPLPLWVYDPETLAVLEVNDAVLRHYGYTREECLSFTLADIRPVEDVPKLQAYFQQHLSDQESGKATFAGTWRHRKKDGSLIDVEITSSIITYHGRRAGLGVVKDITDQKRTLDAIRQSEEAKTRLLERVQASESMFRSIAENAPNFIIELDREGQILFLNRVYPHLRKEELLGSRLQDWTREEYRGIMSAAIARVFETGESQSFEAQGEGPDNTLAWYSSRLGPVIVSGKVASAIMIAHDITQFKRHEEQLREYAQRLQALSRKLIEVQEQERRHLARELHDEIGQILTGLKLSLDLSVRDSQNDVLSNLEEAQQLVKDLTARVRDLSLHLRPTMLDDLGLLPALLWHFQRYTGQTNIQVNFEHGGLDRRLTAELETGIYRIVQEALTNAARHANVKEIRVSIRLHDDNLVLSIEDEGLGFDSTKVVAARASSGLSGMQERAVLLGGRFLVQSATGSGTRLLVEFPIPNDANGGSDDDRCSRR